MGKDKQRANELGEMVKKLKGQVEERDHTIAGQAAMQQQLAVEQGKVTEIVDDLRGDLITAIKLMEGRAARVDQVDFVDRMKAKWNTSIEKKTELDDDEE